MTDQAVQIKYSVTPKSEGMNIRPAHSVDNAPVGALQFGDALTGDLIYEVKVAGEATNAKIGDSWLRLLPLEPNKERWIAIRHNGIDWCIVTEISAVPYKPAGSLRVIPIVDGVEQIENEAFYDLRPKA